MWKNCNQSKNVLFREIKIPEYKILYNMRVKFISHTPRAFFNVIFQGSPYVEKLLDVVKNVPIDIQTGSALLEIMSMAERMADFQVDNLIGYFGVHPYFSTSTGEVVIYSDRYKCFLSLSALYKHYLSTQGAFTQDLIELIKQSLALRVSEVDKKLHYISSYVRGIAILGELMDMPKVTRMLATEPQDDMVVAYFGSHASPGFYSQKGELIGLYQYPLILSDEVPFKSRQMPLCRVLQFEPNDLILFEQWKGPVSAELKMEKEYIINDLPQQEEYDDNFVPVEEIESYTDSSEVNAECADTGLGTLAINLDDSDYDMEILPIEEDDCYTIESEKQYAEDEAKRLKLYEVEDEVLDISVGRLEHHMACILRELKSVNTVIISPEMNLDKLATETEVRELVIETEPQSLVIAQSKVNKNYSTMLVDFLESTEGVLSMETLMCSFKKCEGECFWLTYAISRVDSFCKIVKVRTLGMFDPLAYLKTMNFYESFSVNGKSLAAHYALSSDRYSVMYSNHRRALEKLQGKNDRLYILASYGLISTNYKEYELTPEFEEFRLIDKKDMTQWNEGTRWFIYVIWLLNGRSSLNVGKFKLKLI